MSKTLALLSGKGGSGKTSLALSIATMLNDCDIKVLLVDCDLSTNGATYFFESKLPDDANKTTSFYDIIFNYSNGNYNFINISKCFDFLPSISQISKDNTVTYSYRPKEASEWENFYEQVCKKYDVILFDCQAGYTDILKKILPAIDINLFVMEADAISSAAIRSLYLKIGSFINKKKTYQLFNKVTEEEYEMYSKLSGGTFFTNIGSIIFDWKIRKAFSIAQIPDMKNTSAHYGKQIYDVCNILFTDKTVQENLQKFELVIKMNEKNESEKKTLAKLQKLEEEQNSITKKYTKGIFGIIVLGSAFLAIVTFFILVNRGFVHDLFDNADFLMSGVAISISALASVIINYLNIYSLTKDRRRKYREIEQYEDILRTLQIEKERITSQIKTSGLDITD